MRAMRLVGEKEFRRFLKEKGVIVVEKKEISLHGRRDVRQLEPTGFELEATTVWSFPDRGRWATHKGDYRGNWAPEIPRNLILRYTQRGETVLDQMCGSGTTLVECKLLGRNAIGVDVNLNAVMLTLDRLSFSAGTIFEKAPETEIKVYHGDARNLDKISDNSIDLIATHPPYANIISYSKRKSKSDGDLSVVSDIDEFVENMRQVAAESFRVLKPGKVCAILVGDTRRRKHYVPIAFRTMMAFLDAGFVLVEDIIKLQHNCQSTPLWRKKSLQWNFHLIMHEHLFVFRKPESDRQKRLLKDSGKWW